MMVWYNHPSSSSVKFRLGEIFCGAGGIGLGAKQAAVKRAAIVHAWATDIDRDSCDTYMNNLHPQDIICEDIKKLKLARTLGKDSIDALTFGFPCNDFSVVGKQAGIEGAYGSLYTHCVEAVEHFQPKWFVAENVGGLRNSDGGIALTKIIRELASAGRGYSVYPHLYSFDEYGVPQRRKRVILAGIRQDQGVTFRVPSPDGFRDNDISVKTALANISSDAPNHEYTRHPASVVERLRHIRPGENAFNADLPSELRLNVNGAKISIIYRRLDPDLPSYTVTGSGGGGHACISLEGKPRFN